MGKEIATQVQEAQRVPGRIIPRRNTPTHIVIKLTKIKDKESIIINITRKTERTLDHQQSRISTHQGTYPS